MMATYTWMRRYDHRPLRRRPSSIEIGRQEVQKRCNKCRFYNHATNRVCVQCRELLELRRAKRRPVDLDAQILSADLMIVEWHRKARIALGRIAKWTKTRNRLVRKQVDEARGAVDPAPLVRPGRRALRVREGGDVIVARKAQG